LTSLRPRSLGLLTLSVVLAAFALAFFALNHGGPAQAQEPSPTPTGTGTVSPTTSPTPTGTRTATDCSGKLKGGQTVPGAAGATIKLPGSGNYDVIINPPGTGDPTFTVCHVETQVRVTINALTCREISESVPNQSGAILIGQIVESCQTGAVAGATAISSQAPSTIQPPNTGDAGLR
jgi:hypothetical protein